MWTLGMKNVDSPTSNVDYLCILCQLKNVDSSKPGPTCLRALRAENPLGQMGQVRWAWPDVGRTCLRTFADETIHRRLEEIGIAVSAPPPVTTSGVSAGRAE